jgi:uncharacterized oligopeptide transporter (OPT) family protein
MFAGGVLSWLVLLPLLSIMGNYMTVPLPPVPASGLRIDQMSAGQLWSAYIRYTGAGAVLASGLITLARTIPTIVSSFRDSVKDFGAGKGGAKQTRTERDLPATVVLIGSLALAVFLAIAPKMPTQGNFLAAVLIVVFGFFFVTVSSRITGLIGSSSNPISGPIYQQIGLLIGVITSALVIGMTTLYLHRVMVIGSGALPAPQATLMATIIKGLLSQNLPWGLVLVGVFISVTLELCGIHSLSFAVGSYLPIATTAPIFAGGLVRWFVERKTGVAEESEVGSGTLFSSGLIAGGSLAGILYAVLFGRQIIKAADDSGTLGLIPPLHEGTLGMVAGGLLFAALGVVLARAAQKKLA